MNKKTIILDLVLLVLSMILMIGVKVAFHGCPVGDSESIMACHWAEQAVFGIGIALTIQAVLLLLGGKSGLRAGIIAAMIPTALIGTLIPGGLIRLCMMPEMHCRSAMRPAVMVLGIVIMVVAAMDLIITVRSDRKKNN